MSSLSPLAPRDYSDYSSIWEADLHAALRAAHKAEAAVYLALLRARKHCLPEQVSPILDAHNTSPFWTPRYLSHDEKLEIYHAHKS